MNFSDSERFEKILSNAGLEKADSIEEADLLIFNSCSVRQKAEDRILGLRKVIEGLKKSNPHLTTVLTGCMARRVWDDRNGKIVNEKWERKLHRQMKWLDLVLETKKFPSIIEELFKNDLFDKKSVIKTDKFFDIKPNYKSKFQAFLPISFGCDHFCSYCIVPFARGREVCRDYDSIVTEFKELVDKGYKDITLLGQTVNRWINPDYKGKLKIKDLNKDKFKSETPADFLQLLRALDEIEGDYWLSFTSSHPMYFTEELIDFYSKSKHLRHYLHFAMQSGNDEVLESMRRDYTYQMFSDVVERFKEKIPGMAITTDIIVGFPGETQEQFEDTKNAMEELEFDMAYLSEYSPRLGTKSAQMKDDISHKEKERRKDVLNEILRVTSGKQKKDDVGKVLKCLSYKATKARTFLRTEKNRDVLIEGKVEMGEFVNIEITDCTEWSLKGRIV